MGRSHKEPNKPCYRNVYAVPKPPSEGFNLWMYKAHTCAMVVGECLLSYNLHLGWVINTILVILLPFSFTLPFTIIQALILLYFSFYCTKPGHDDPVTPGLSCLFALFLVFLAAVRWGVHAYWGGRNY
eukprot:GDKI01045444.1.p1 GENE.GDKI01045444.1~~GDKI01045444.1.p1  ORF type:complete len:128 (+),score=20.30 GDKI01045444.1:181-564(+)